jgi:hypothetical protein
LFAIQPLLFPLFSLSDAIAGAKLGGAKKKKNNVSHFKSNYVLIFLDKRQSCMGDNLITDELGASARVQTSEQLFLSLVICDNCF